MWKDPCVQGCDLWNTQHVGGCETELPRSWHSLRVSMDSCSPLAKHPPHRALERGTAQPSPGPGQLQGTGSAGPLL